MRRTLIVTVSVGVLLVFWFCHGLNVEAGGGGGAAPVAETFGTGDTNGDHNIDLADAVYLLNWLFLGGDAPHACAAELPVDPTFAESIAGTYLVCDPDQIGKAFLSTIHSDGTESTTLGNEFAENFVHRYASVSRGAWTQTGDPEDPEDLESTHTEVAFVYDADGVIIGVQRLRVVVTWLPDFSGYSGTWTGDILSSAALQCGGAGQTPFIDNTAERLYVGNGQVTASRISN